MASANSASARGAASCHKFPTYSPGGASCLYLWPITLEENCALMAKCAIYDCLVREFKANLAGHGGGCEASSNFITPVGLNMDIAVEPLGS